MTGSDVGACSAPVSRCPAAGTGHRLVQAALVGASVALLAGNEAKACLRPAPIDFSIDPALRGVDFAPPSAPLGVTAAASRTSGEFCRKDGLCTASSCGSTGSLQLEFESALDDRSQPGELGYRLKFVSGSVPSELEVALSRIPAGTSPLHFDLPFDPVVDLDATFELVALDRAGNESAGSEPFRVAFDGCTHALDLQGCVEDMGGRVTCSEGICSETADLDGCSLAPGAATNGRARSSAGGLGLMIAGCALVWRRRAASPTGSDQRRYRARC